MIETDNQANDRAVNTLLNFETVKYFGMAHREREELGRNIDSVLPPRSLAPAAEQICRPLR